MPADLEAPVASLRQSPLTVLRETTRHLHRQLEASIDLASAFRSRQSYATLLLSYLGIYMAFEETLSPFRSALSQSGWHYHSRVEPLQNDLYALGFLAETLAASGRTTTSVPLHTFDHALGALYVIEGSALGGQILYRQIRESLGLDVRTGASFFYGEGAQTGTSWKRFTLVLDQYVADSDEAAETACQMFAAFEHALSTTKGND
jgi:heme oxygenase